MKYYKIDTNGFYEEDVITDKEIKDNTLISIKYKGGFYKPLWNGSAWVEGATEEEIKAWEENKPMENKEENLIDKLILDNINMQMQIDSLIEASLGGN